MPVEFVMFLIMKWNRMFVRHLLQSRYPCLPTYMTPWLWAAFDCSPIRPLQSLSTCLVYQSKKIMTNNLFSTFVKWKKLTSLLWLYSSASTNILCNSSEWHGDFWSVSAHQMHSMLFIIFCFIQERKNCCRMQMSMPVMILQRKCALMLGVSPLSCILRLLFVLYFWWMGYHPCFLL